MKLFYLANIRLPTEKAHGLQIVQMCEAFACSGANVTLLVPRRYNPMKLDVDMWTYYGVARSFDVRRLWCLDVFRFVLPNVAIMARLTDMLRTLTFILALCIHLASRRHEPGDLYYSRDLLTLLFVSLFKPRQALVYEAHQLSKSRLGAYLQSLCARRVGLVIAVTGKMASDLAARGASRTLIAHDGIRLERFAKLPTQREARQKLGIAPDAFVAGYVGQLHTMSMSKGVDLLIEAIAKSGRPIALGLVGGPETMADALRKRWLALGLPAEGFVFLGRVDPVEVPACLAAFDVCTMPFPWTEHFAYYASPLKLFEYMASGKAIISSDLPATVEVVQNGESALLYPPGDVEALSAALTQLYDDPALRERLGTEAKREAIDYAWQTRAERILQAVKD
jgi:glycosyltransferase involved in cell wall biosynthesis